ncbi:MAG: 6-carboxytetrahydropterin synthase [Alphaproteobacteria bacterium]|nr:6-carboxytetrahydropterin synthase [Alphaproteobacteria bacterium]
MSISKEFRFDAAHFLPTAPQGHPNSRMHGHSFAAVLTLEGDADAAHGWVRDFAEIEAAVGDLRARLDHHVLNEIKGLETPTLERIARYVFDALKDELPELACVTVRRDSLGESCSYRRA